MEFIHDRKSNILFSLYGSKVNRIRIHNKTLTLTVDEMYQLVDGEERAFSGEISFKDYFIGKNMGYFLTRYTISPLFQIYIIVDTGDFLSAQSQPVYVVVLA